MSNTPETDNLARGNHVVPTEFAQDLERKLRKARDTVYRLRKHRAIARNFGKQMERERDEARVAFAIATDRCVEAQSNERAAQAKSGRAEKMLRIAAAKVDAQAERIRQLEGATNHAGGTPLSQWRECAEGLASALHQMSDMPDYAEFALTQFERLKETSK
jgi:hypothetical protein